MKNGIADYALEDDPGDLPKPGSCRDMGLQCPPCVRQSGANLARICENLTNAAIRESFFKIYPDHACLPMARTFARAYRTAQAELNETLDEFALIAVPA